MASGAFKCEKCDRTFAMAAHLGRHMSTIHGAAKKAGKSGPKAKRGPGRPKGSGRKVGRPAGATASAKTSAFHDDGARVLNEMASYQNYLSAQRESLDAKIDAVAEAMRALGASAPARAGRKPGRKPGPKPGRKPGRPAGKRKSGARAGSLKDFIVRVLGQTTRPMSPSDIGSRVKSAGFKTKAKDLTKAVSNVLPTIKKIKRVGFGQYQLGG